MFRELLYTLFWDGMGHTLMTYDIHHNKWNEIGVQLPESLRVPQLAVACDHLFMVAARDSQAQGEGRKHRPECRANCGPQCPLRSV